MSERMACWQAEQESRVLPGNKHYPRPFSSNIHYGLADFPDCKVCPEFIAVITPAEFAHRVKNIEAQPPEVVEAFADWTMGLQDQEVCSEPSEEEEEPETLGKIARRDVKFVDMIGQETEGAEKQAPTEARAAVAVAVEDTGELMKNPTNQRKRSTPKSTLRIPNLRGANLRPREPKQKPSCNKT